MRVRKTLTRTENGRKLALGEPKTKKSRRTVRLTPRAVEALWRHRARQAEEKLKAGGLYEDQGLVFAGEVGNLINPSNLRQRSFAPLLHRAGLLFQRNVHPKFVQELTGHASVAITLDTYSHMLPGMGGEAADAMGEVMSCELSGMDLSTPSPIVSRRARCSGASTGPESLFSLVTSGHRAPRRRRLPWMGANWSARPRRSGPGRAGAHDLFRLEGDVRPAGETFSGEPPTGNRIQQGCASPARPEAEAP